MDLYMEELNVAKNSAEEKAEAILQDIENVSQLNEKLRSFTILTPEHWRVFVLVFEKRCPGYIDAIKNFHPDISAAELRLMVLQKLGLNYNQMSLMLGLTTAAMRKTKSRIFKKYQVLDFEQILSF